METVVDDGRLGAGDAGGRREAGPHVHGCRHHGFALLQRQGFQQRQGVGGAAAFHHLQHAPILEIGHERNVVLPTAEAHLVEADLGGLLSAAACQFPHYVTCHDGNDTVPIQLQQLGGLRE